MKKQPMRATGLVAAGVVAGGILAGTLGAQAANDANNEDDGRARDHVIVHHEGPGGPGGDTLAKELGVSPEKLREAFAAIGDEVRPAKRPDGPPSEAEMKAMHDELVASLADELGLSEAKVQAAMDTTRKAHEAERRDALSDRLDDAVDDGTLTEDDKASVLKAYDAGVLGGPGLGGPGHRMVMHAEAKAD